MVGPRPQDYCIALFATSASLHIAWPAHSFKRIAIQSELAQLESAASHADMLLPALTPYALPSGVQLCFVHLAGPITIRSSPWGALKPSRTATTKPRLEVWSMRWGLGAAHLPMHKPKSAGMRCCKNLAHIDTLVQFNSALKCCDCVRW